MCSGHYSTKYNWLKEEDKGLKRRKCTSPAVQYLVIPAVLHGPAFGASKVGCISEETFLTAYEADKFLA